ncbi:MAG: type II 3-dehydroquinate dehydratase [Saprospiraceae bacterium]|nr:type II 3-dehydroquinate dehydratase [Saprospiraceae bacterium]
MKKIIIINGPNLNLLGKREVDIYGNMSFEHYFEILREHYQKKIELEYFQSNHEGKIIDKIHDVGYSYDGIILNGGAFTHTSLAIADALSAITTPAIEVHISNIHARESYRSKSLTAAKAIGSIAGLGLDGYRLAIEHHMQRLDLSSDI